MKNFPGLRTLSFVVFLGIAALISWAAAPLAEAKESAARADQLGSSVPWTLARSVPVFEPEIPDSLLRSQTIREYCQTFVDETAGQVERAARLSCNVQARAWQGVDDRRRRQVKSCLRASGLPRTSYDFIRADRRLRRNTLPDFIDREHDLLACKARLDAVEFESRKQKKACARYGHSASTFVRQTFDRGECRNARRQFGGSEHWSLDASVHTNRCRAAGDYKKFIRNDNALRNSEITQCRVRQSNRASCRDFADKALAQIRIARSEGCSRLARRWTENRRTLVKQCMSDPFQAERLLDDREAGLSRCVDRRGRRNGELNPEGIVRGIIGALISNELGNNGINGSVVLFPPNDDRPTSRPRIVCDQGKVANRAGRCVFPVPNASRATVRKDQTCLRVVGHNAGTPDGIPGRQTRAAVQDFLNRRGLFVQDTLYPEARKRLYRECDARLNVIRSDQAGDGSGQVSKLDCLGFTQWDAYVQRNIKPPLPLCSQ